MMKHWYWNHSWPPESYTADGFVGHSVVILVLTELVYNTNLSDVVWGDNIY